MKPILSHRQLVFISEYMKHGNATRAALRAGYSETSAPNEGYLLTKNHDVAEEIRKRQTFLANANNLTAADVAAAITSVLRADPEELITHWRGACRHCHGIAFQYQYRPQEMRDAYVKHLKTDEGKNGVPFDGQGGDGYNSQRDPHPDCPECEGKGVSRSMIKDFRTVSPEGRALYAGLKVTSQGTEVLMHSKQKAVDQAAKILGMNKAEINVNLGLKAKDLSDDELATIAAGNLAQAKEGKK